MKSDNAAFTLRKTLTVEPHHMISRIAKGAAPVLASLFALKLNGYLQSITVPKHEALMMSAGLAAIVALIFDEIVDGFRKNVRFFRKILDKRARFEGDWFVQAEPGSRMPYGAVAIDYNPDSDVYTYSGAAYDSQGKLASEWSCEDVQFDLPHAKIQFICRTSIKGDVGTPHQSYGWICFKKIPLRRRMRYFCGDGYFTVIDKPEMKGEFNLERLDRRYVQKILGRSDIGTREDMAKIVYAYHQKKTAQTTSNQDVLT